MYGHPYTQNDPFGFVIQLSGSISCSVVGWLHVYLLFLRKWKKRSLCMYRSIHTKRPLIFCWLSFSRVRAENSAMREMGMKKAGLFSKSGCNWWVTPGSNPSSKEKRANPIYENETHFLREKSPQTLGITGKKHCRTFLFGNDGGGRWIRTTEVSDNRFTVCPLWPLGNSPMPYWIWM